MGRISWSSGSSRLIQPFRAAFSCLLVLRSLKCLDGYFSGWILIDRCGKHFGTILNYLRDDTIALPKHRQEIKELMAEAKYYLIQGLVDMCQAALQVRNRSSL